MPSVIFAFPRTHRFSIPTLIRHTAIPRNFERLFLATLDETNLGKLQMCNEPERLQPSAEPYSLGHASDRSPRLETETSNQESTHEHLEQETKRQYR
jgi:hypothetical protein